jgi:threonine/homoserine/homoserine lactone efflux protein
LGAAYLCYLGWGALTAKHGIAQNVQSGTKSWLSTSAREGFLISILSPKIMVFFTALFGQFVASTSTQSENIALVLTPFLIDGLWYSIVAFVLSTPRFMARLQQKAVWIDRFSGAILILLGLRVILYSADMLFT